MIGADGESGTMLKIEGLVDGPIPAGGSASDALDVALSELRLDCVALYAKCAQVGYRSALPFLASHPDPRGFGAGPGALRRLVDHLHSRDVRVGAVVQIHRYDAAAWGEESVWWRDEVPRPAESVAAADSPEFRRRLRQALHEVVTLFPDLDLVFLEGEPFTAAVLRGPLKAWLAAKGLPFESPGEDLTFDPETARTTSALGVRLDPTWSTEGLAFGVDLTRSAMEVADETFEDADWRGIRGLVYPSDGPAGRSAPVAAAGGPWWLVPRVATGSETPRAQARRRTSRQHLLRAKRYGNRVCMLLELDPAESRAGEAEARELSALAREQLDGLLVKAPAPERSADRLREEGGFKGRPA